MRIQVASHEEFRSICGPPIVDKTVTAASWKRFFQHSTCFRKEYQQRLLCNPLRPDLFELIPKKFSIGLFTRTYLRIYDEQVEFWR